MRGPWLNEKCSIDKSSQNIYINNRAVITACAAVIVRTSSKTRKPTSRLLTVQLGTRISTQTSWYKMFQRSMLPVQKIPQSSAYPPLICTELVCCTSRTWTIKLPFDRHSRHYMPYEHLDSLKGAMPLNTTYAKMVDFSIVHYKTPFLPPSESGVGNNF